MPGDADITLRAPPPDELPAPTISLRLLFEAEHGYSSSPPVVLEREIAVGRSTEDCPLRVRDPRVSRKHAVFRVLRGIVTLEDMSSNGTFVNGLRIEGTRMLNDGDIVRVGDSFLLLRFSPPARLDVEAPVIHELAGLHPSLENLRRTIAVVAPTDAKVLIVGESGTGKELIARAIHARSGRRDRFIAVNCSAIPESLAESQLFGHAAGSFTGAQGDHDGFMRAASGGTLFLDEIGELSMALQPKLLRAIEEQKVMPVGRTSPVDVDVRLIAATNRNLLQEVDAGRFRGDLYARLAGYVIHTRPLRERKEDVLFLLDRFLGQGVARPSFDLVEALLLHPFRFNVRELKEIATQLRIDGAGLPELPLSLVLRRLGHDATPSGAMPLERSSSILPPRPKEAPPSKEYVDALLHEYHANISQVAKALGRSRRQVYRYIEEYGLSLDDYKRDGT
jgi:DNA-binding NtrC family response regulator